MILPRQRTHAFEMQAAVKDLKEADAADAAKPSAVSVEWVASVELAPIESLEADPKQLSLNGLSAFTKGGAVVKASA